MERAWSVQVALSCAKQGLHSTILCCWCALIHSSPERAIFSRGLVCSSGGGGGGGETAGNNRAGVYALYIPNPDSRQPDSLSQKHQKRQVTDSKGDARLVLLVYWYLVYVTGMKCLAGDSRIYQARYFCYYCTAVGLLVPGIRNRHEMPCRRFPLYQARYFCYCTAVGLLVVIVNSRGPSYYNAGCPTQYR